MSTQSSREGRAVALEELKQSMQNGPIPRLLDMVEVRPIWGPRGLTGVECRCKVKGASKREGAAPETASPTS